MIGILLLLALSVASLASAPLLEEARREGAVRIQRRDGEAFIVRPEKRTGSPFDVEGVDLGLTADEIVAFVREGRERHE